MPARDVLRHPHPSLKRVAEPLDFADPSRIERVAVDLLDTMAVAPGCVGIAAPQIDEVVQMIAVDVTGHRKAQSCGGRIVLVNPTVVSEEGGEVGREGCLSIPDFTANVRRATNIVVDGFEVDGTPRRVEADAFEARCLLHEIDHLEGILFLDRVESLTKDVFPRKRYK